jgi:DNA-binding transcriptional LysR family regulator
MRTAGRFENFSMFNGGIAKRDGSIPKMRENPNHGMKARTAADRPLRFDMESLRIFVAVVEERSIAAASARTHLVASAVSKRVSDLEGDAGTPLLYRHSRGVQATPAGEALYHHAKRLIEHLQQISDELSEYSEGVRGHARIYVNFTAMVQYLPGALHSFLRANPQVRIDMVEKSSDEVVQAIASGVADLGICSATGEAIGELQWHPYNVDKLMLIVPGTHPLAARGKVRFAEALDEDFVSMPHGTSISKLCRAAAERDGRRLRVRIEVTSFEGVRNMVSAGLGLGVLPEGSVMPYALSGAFSVVELDEPWSLRPLIIVARNFGTLPMPARLLVDHLERREESAGSS